jgi:ferritin-like metal-binding protein YciE
MESLKELFEETLKDVYFAEKQIIKALPKMARKTKRPELKAAFEEHVEQTKVQVERLDQVFKLLGKKSSGKECPALLGLVEEAEEIMSEAKDPDVLAAGLIGAAQAVEHYEIARYGTLVAWAQQLGMTEAQQLLEETLEEEKTTDQKLTQLALAGVNQDAEDEEGEDDEGEEDAPESKSKAKPKSGAKSPAKPAAKSSASKAPAKTKAASSSSGASRSGSASSNSAKSSAKKK